MSTYGRLILRNANGIELRDDNRFGDHLEAIGARCCCGERLIVAPMIFNADHRKGDPVMVCGDHGTHAYRFKSLVKGNQPEE